VYSAASCFCTRFPLRSHWRRLWRRNFPGPAALFWWSGHCACARCVVWDTPLYSCLLNPLPQPELVCFWFSPELPAVLGFWMPVRWANVFLRGVDVPLVTCVACNQADAPNRRRGGGAQDGLWLCVKVAWTLVEYVLWLLWALLLPGALYSFVLGAVQALPQHSNCRVQSYLGVTPVRTFSKVLYFCLYGKAEYLCHAAFRVMRRDHLVASGHFASVGCASHIVRSRTWSLFKGNFTSV
jgi:hypothetical protein